VGGVSEQLLGGLPVVQGGSCYDLPGICFVWYSHAVAEQGETLCLDNSQKVWLLAVMVMENICSVTVAFWPLKSNA